MKICISGGGTGGHLMIAQALVEAGVQRGHEIIFIGSMSGQDRAYFETDSLFSQVYFLDTKGVVNQKGLAKIVSLVKILKAFFISRKILKKHKIEATYSVGGFSAAPASFASLSLFIPLYIHEQNAVSGRLNSLLKPFAKRFISAYDTSSPIQGYPIKESFVKSARLRKKLETIIFLGGSQGARAINDLALDVAKDLKDKGVSIIHQCGERDLERVRAAYKEQGVDVELYGFTKEIDSLIARADLAVSRAGASTLWELVANGVPTLFIPYPYAASDHQYFNAKFIVENDLGWCYREDEDLKGHVLNLVTRELEDKSKRLLEYSNENVAQKMIQDIEEARS
jgi:UDP-N-acetylglucosamine--N-acetylmuramyl-(pentapeptide) pyrophosphoryl-undecaprenol N-acetylglucosamine transferase